MTKQERLERQDKVEDINKRNSHIFNGNSKKFKKEEEILNPYRKKLLILGKGEKAHLCIYSYIFCYLKSI